jgi:hypothetical protein
MAHDLPHGTALGTAACGVVGYNCNYKNIPADTPYDHLSYVRAPSGALVYSGDKWQCVELVRRWYVQAPAVFHACSTSYSIDTPPIKDRIDKEFVVFAVCPGGFRKWGATCPIPLVPAIFGPISSTHLLTS